jgi:hypothetical protein
LDDFSCWQHCLNEPGVLADQDGGIVYVTGLAGRQGSLSRFLIVLPQGPFAASPAFDKTVRPKTTRLLHRCYQRD